MIVIGVGEVLLLQLLLLARGVYLACVRSGNAALSPWVLLRDSSEKLDSSRSVWPEGTDALCCDTTDSLVSCSWICEISSYSSSRLLPRSVTLHVPVCPHVSAETHRWTKRLEKSLPLLLTSPELRVTLLISSLFIILWHLSEKQRQERKRSGPEKKEHMSTYINIYSDFFHYRNLVTWSFTWSEFVRSLGSLSFSLSSWIWGYH